MFSIACFSVSVRNVSVQSNCLRHLVLESGPSSELIFPFFLSSNNFLRIFVCIGVWSSGFRGSSGVGNQKVLFCCSGLFVLRSSFRKAVRLGSPCGIILRIAICSGLRFLDCSGVTMKNFAICVFFLIRYGDSVVLATLTANLLLIIVDIEWEISKLAVSVNFSIGVTVPVVFHSDGGSTEAVIDSVILCGIVSELAVMTGWGFASVSLEADLTCILKCGKCMRPSVVSMTTLLFLIKCHTVVGPLNFFTTTNCLAITMSPIRILGVTVANGFSKWPFDTCI